MRDILVLTGRSKDYQFISDIANSPPKAYCVRQAHDLETAKEMHTATPFDMIIADIELLVTGNRSKQFNLLKEPFLDANPFVQLIVLCDGTDTTRAMKAVEQGAAGYLVSPVQAKEFQMLILSASRTRLRDFELDYLRDRFWKTEWLDIIRSRNPGMKKIFDNVRSVAPTVATVLLLGETGTGKGTLARLIHWHSERYEKPFIAIHCGAIPENLIESELFGHEKGSFTGAERKKPGRFEMAEGGTLFLDEIGTISPSTQIKLLQVLQDGSFTRVGGESVLKADVRIIAATNAKLEDLVKKGEFRKDLYYRLNIFPIEIPPLKDRLEDLDYLIQVFLKKLDVKYGKGIQKINDAVLKSLKRYDWPGNIRELENILERAYILERTKELTPAGFPLEMLLSFDDNVDQSCEGMMTLAQARQHAVDTFEISYLRALLAQTNGKINAAAQSAGITPRQLNRLLTRHGLDKKEFKSRQDI
ncbi:sigma-54 dependent transcriptional regulator [uncultured Desulfobacter sp.]|uniref:sigma-54 dependent transcriptional regulator n=1 Tax=uncultured Desulfobacter sp. TaxID=240139 RepID=UPI002AAB5CFB|nr:sigma-54 dependent transcriptional regulator [uncultured Desulfobacter sp.]